MPRHIAIVLGHPDPAGNHFGNALADAYAKGAAEGGHEVRIIDIAKLDFPLLRTQEDFEKGTPPPSIQEAQATILWAQHIVILFPLWLGTMPALVKAFLEQVFRPNFVQGRLAPMDTHRRPLLGKSSRIIVTMGMPAFFYRWYFRAHGVRGLERNVLGFCGIKPIHETLIGAVAALSDAGRKKWLGRMRALGRAGS
jgi:putative NADPH-quinone reductase